MAISARAGIIVPAYDEEDAYRTARAITSEYLCGELLPFQWSTFMCDEDAPDDSHELAYEVDSDEGQNFINSRIEMMRKNRERTLEKIEGLTGGRLPSSEDIWQENKLRTYFYRLGQNRGSQVNLYDMYGEGITTQSLYEDALIQEPDADMWVVPVFFE